MHIPYSLNTKRFPERFRIYLYKEGMTKHTEMGQKTCKPVHKFGFLKTHKCGSTTIQNMLLRYVVNHDLRLVVPVDGKDF